LKKSNRRGRIKERESFERKKKIRERERETENKRESKREGNF
jgi:hypothetical protein